MEPAARGLFRDAEQGEVDAAVCAVLEEMGERREVVIAGVLYDEERSGSKHGGVKHKPRYLSEAGMVIRGVGEYEVECRAGGGYKAEHIAAHQSQILLVEHRSHFVDEAELCGCFLNGGD